jgi:hypothetical protein
LIKHHGKYHHLLDFSKDFESYLTLESLTLDKYKNKFIYTISLENSNQKLRLGRGHDCDILLSDISVSRVHCFLLADKMNKNLFLIDNDSKFGTLVLIQTPILKIEELLPLNIQIGRTYIKCVVKKPFKLFDCCNAEEFSNIFYYFEQNEKKVNQHINLIIKSDDEDLNDNNTNLENKTCEQKYPDKINGEYTYEKYEIINNKSKITDDEYFRVRHLAESKNKNLGDTLIDDDKDSNEEDKNSINILNNTENDNEGKNAQNNNDEENQNNDDNDNDENINCNDDKQNDDFDENDATIQ